MMFSRLLSSFFLSSCVLVAQAVTPFSVRNNPRFQSQEKLLTELVQSRAKSRINHFWIVGYPVQGDIDQAWIYWAEDRALILWEGNVDPAYPLPLITSRRYLHLDRDMVETEDDINGSTYLVSKAWANKTIVDAIKYGDSYIIRKKLKRRR